MCTCSTCDSESPKATELCKMMWELYMRTLFVILTLSENTWSMIDMPSSVINNRALSGTALVGVKDTVI